MRGEFIYSLIGVMVTIGVQFGNLSPTIAAADNQWVCEAEMDKASRQYDVPLGVLYAVGLTETGRKMRLHPFALNISGRSFFASSRGEALAEFEKARQSGHRLIDLGCMQINHHYHGQNFPSAQAMLDPHANVQYAAKFLSQLRVREKNWTMAVARYHAGPNNDPAQRRYICHVIKNLVRTKFGRWTAQARDFCQKH